MIEPIYNPHDVPEINYSPFPIRVPRGAPPVLPALKHFEPQAEEYLVAQFGVPTVPNQNNLGLRAWRSRVANTDTVPAMLTPKEAVLNVNAAELAGRGNIKKLNAAGNKLAKRGVNLAT
jgi:hypothetical protein